ncbi:MAG: ABC transporter permease [Gaiellales bacterium]
MSQARIHDVRYRPYEGEIRGSARRAVESMARWSALRALGARRPWTAKIVPVGLALIAFGPAITVLGVKALIGATVTQQLPGDIVPFATYYQLIAFAILAYAAIVIPETLCPDRRSRVLDLYLSTAMSPREYVLGKVLASAVPLLAVTTLPLLFLYVGNVFFSDDPFGYIGSHLRELPAILIGGVLIAVVYTLMGLAVASLTGRRAFATVGFVLLLIVSGLIGGVLRDVLNLGPNSRIVNLQFQPVWLAQKIIGEAPPSVVKDGPLQRFDTPDTTLLIISNAVIVLVCVAVLALRYRRSDA